MVISPVPLSDCEADCLLTFPDTYDQPRLIQTSSNAAVSQTYNMTDRGITWPGEASKYGNTTYQPGQAVPPPFWALRYPNNYTQAGSYPDLASDEHFQVWMRTAGLPTFRKLYYRNDNEAMQAGRYEMRIFMSALCSLLPLLIAADAERYQTTLSLSSEEPNPSSSARYLSLAARTLSSVSPTLS